MKINTGILGLGSKSTLYYIEELNRLYKKEHGGFSTFPFKLLNTNFDEINSLLPNYSEELDTAVTKYLYQLLELNIQAILIPNITIHETVDKIIDREKMGATIIHPLIETNAILQDNNVKEVLLLGTYYTMNSTYINSYFKKNNILVMKPSQQEMETIDRIRKEVYIGVNINGNTKLLKELTDRFTQDHHVVIACTELSMINSESNVRIHDMAKIQIEETLLQSSIK